ncbi:Dimethylallyltranstransferase [Dactylellina cionopaga]|nr:Dimethylallyltranstransferase [Dactylellina cionopaga]
MSCADILREHGLDVDSTSTLLDIAAFNRQGFCEAEGYELRIHKFAGEAQAGTDELRSDWSSYVGPLKEWGNDNAIDGNFIALSIPMCRPERLRLVAYAFEFGFLYDSTIENSPKDATLDTITNYISANESIHPSEWTRSGLKQIQAKILLTMNKVDPVITEGFINAWEQMINTTVQDKDRDFDSLDDYLRFRVIDTGAIFSGLLVLFGIGVQLKDDEFDIAHELLFPAWSAATLVNDYFSFDKEYHEYLETGGSHLSNAVWLFMRLYSLDIETAKEAIRKESNRLEFEFLKVREDFAKKFTPNQLNVLIYIESWFHILPGNSIWSVNCPRYNADLRPGLALPPTNGSTRGIKDQIFGSLVIENEAQPALLLHCDAPSTRSDSESNISTADKNDISISSVGSSPPPSDDSSAEHENKSEGKLGEKHVLAPYNYLASMPSKGVREKFVEALNLWFDIPENIEQQIKDVGKVLHTASIMLDDMEDSSPLRRGKDAAHVVYGDAQAINSANYLIVWAMDQTRKLNNPACMDIFLDEIQNSLVGQSYEMHWRDNLECPTEDQYLEMVEKKTGGLFRFLTRLLVAMARTNKDLNLNNLAVAIGQYFQIRDDYMNLTDTKYTDQKGFCEDLDEGKFSYLIMHAWNSPFLESARLRAIFEQRKTQNNKNMTRETKEEILSLLHTIGSFEYTENKMNQLQQQLDSEVCQFEELTGKRNWSLRFLLEQLYKK